MAGPDSPGAWEPESLCVSEVQGQTRPYTQREAAGREKGKEVIIIHQISSTSMCALIE